MAPTQSPNILLLPMFPSFHFVPLLSSFFPRARSSLFPNAEDSRLRLTAKPPLGTGYIHTGYVCIQSKAWTNLVTQSHSLNPEGRRKIEVDSASERPPSETGTPIKGAPRQVSVMANSCRGHNEISLCVWFVLPLRERKGRKERRSRGLPMRNDRIHILHFSPLSLSPFFLISVKIIWRGRIRVRLLFCGPSSGNIGFSHSAQIPASKKPRPRCYISEL